MKDFTISLPKGKKNPKPNKSSMGHRAMHSQQMSGLKSTQQMSSLKSGRADSSQLTS